MMRAGLLALALVVGLGAAACTSTPSPPPEAAAAVTLWGDSFGETVAPYLSYREHVYGGTAPCDWRDHVANSPAPRTAVLLFVGNKLAEGDCNYPDAVAAITRDLESRGSRVVWIAAPYMPILPLARQILNGIYPSPEHGPADSVGGAVALVEYRAPDGNHLNVTGAERFARAIEEVVET
jgi:hypothetical protein